MKISAIAISLALLTASCTTETKLISKTAPTPIANPPLQIADLRSRPIIGELGKPLGICFEVDASIFRGSELRTKQDAGRYLLNVTRIDGDPLPQPVLMHFEVPGFVQSNLVNDEMALLEKMNGKTIAPVGIEQVRAMEAGYVGKTVRLTAYEKGGFYGMPDRLPQDAPTWQDHGFEFETWLVVVVDRSQQ